MAELPPHGLIAELASDDDLLRAARAMAARGYTRMDAFGPRPIEALQELIAPERSTLPRSVLIGGVLGALTGLGVQWFCNAYDFPLNVGGRPPFSLPAFIPITFELMVLFAAIVAFAGSIVRGKLPWLSHAMFGVPGFERASIDRFWLFIAADDPLYVAEQTREALSRLGALRVTPVPPEPARTPPEGAPASATGSREGSA
jgi:Alternative complex III, ActD subunit